MGLGQAEEELRSTVRPTARKDSAGISMHGFDLAAFLDPRSFSRLVPAAFATRRRVARSQVERAHVPQLTRAVLLRFGISTAERIRRHAKPRQISRMPRPGSLLPTSCGAFMINEPFIVAGGVAELAVSCRDGISWRPDKLTDMLGTLAAKGDSPVMVP